MFVKHFGCTEMHNEVLYKCIIHSFIHSFKIRPNPFINYVWKPYNGCKHIHTYSEKYTFLMTYYFILTNGAVNIQMNACMIVQYFFIMFELCVQNIGKDS